MAQIRAAIGFKLHTGWVAAVAVTRRQNVIEILLRRRLELLPESGAVPRFVYHKAAELPPADAGQLVLEANRLCRDAAHSAVGEVLKELRYLESIRAAGMATGSAVIPENLGTILASHALIHAAEGRFFEEVMAAACEMHGLALVRVRERELRQKLDPAAGQALDEMRLRVGPPWGADQKTAAAAALVALDSILGLRHPLTDSPERLPTKNSRRAGTKRRPSPRPAGAQDR